MTLFYYAIPQAVLQEKSSDSQWHFLIYNPLFQRPLHWRHSALSMMVLTCPFLLHPGSVSEIHCGRTIMVFPEETLEELFRKVNVSGSFGLMENCLWCVKLNCNMIEKCTHNFKSMGKVWKWGCFYFSLTFMKCSFPHDEILLGPFWWNLVHKVFTAESSRVLSRMLF